ncbi:MAG: prepilin-type N-terminal cleavage/methylation domain-containing protein, partial [Gammaproteobacteria bacterium]|nr:prepilin-type N-terminal cleavage/methylation domain-containing protein [Gammaproteobacteria bacterium]
MDRHLIGGLSLLELLVALAIVAGLAALALPLYRGYV